MSEPSDTLSYRPIPADVAAGCCDAVAFEQSGRRTGSVGLAAGQPVGRQIAGE